MQKLKQISLWLLLALLTYQVLALITHHIIFPVQSPEYSAYFKQGSNFSSSLEGMTQKVMQVNGNELQVEVTLKPHALGPVAHMHENFNETFIVKQGTLSLKVDSEVKRLHAGERFTIPANTSHKPFNETDSLVVVQTTLPADFAYCLSQCYPFWDAKKSNSQPPTILLQLSVFGSKFDSYPTEDAPPKPLLKAIMFMLAPTARLLGYSYYNPAYTPLLTSAKAFFD